jgi:hypothetical protein
MRWPAGRLVDLTGAVDTGPPAAAASGARPWHDSAAGGGVLALSALPALIVTVIPANDTLKLLGLGPGTALISTLTTACLLLAMVGAMVVIGLNHPQEVMTPASSGDASI